MVINIPNFKEIEIKNIVFDYNGTIAKDGELKNIKEYLEILKREFKIFVITADTHGSVRENMKNLTNVHILTSDNHTLEKAEFVKNLKNVFAVGNGNNDALMLKESDIGVCVIGDEGASSKAIINSDIVVKDIKDAFELLLNPKRLIATLRR